MDGGVSDFGSRMKFIPKSGRKKRNAAPPVAEVDEEIHDAGTAERGSDEDYSEYYSTAGRLSRYRCQA